MRNGHAVCSTYSSRSHEEAWKGEFDHTIQSISSYYNLPAHLSNSFGSHET